MRQLLIFSILLGYFSVTTLGYFSLGQSKVALENSARKRTAAGCVYKNQATGEVECDYQSWVPPLNETDFNPTAPFRITIKNINGSMPNGSFSGLLAATAAVTKHNTSNPSYIHLKCQSGGILELEPDTFSGELNWIDSLTISDCIVKNGIKENAFSQLSEIITLEIVGGSIDTLYGTSLSGLTKIETLVISANILSGILPDNFLHHSTLKTIDMETSALSSLSSNSFKGLTALTTLNIKDNNLTTLPESVLYDLVSLTQLKLNGNPWKCSCDMYWFVKWNLFTEVTVDTVITCDSPEIYRGLYLSSVVFALGCETVTQTTTATLSTQSSDKYLDPAWIFVIITIGAVTFVLFVCMIIMGCAMYKWYKQLKYGRRPNSVRVTPSPTPSADSFHPLPRKINSSSTSSVSSLEPIFPVQYRNATRVRMPHM